MDMLLRRMFQLEDEFNQLKVWHCKNPYCTKSLCVKHKAKRKFVETELNNTEYEYSRILAEHRGRHIPNYIDFSMFRSLSSRNLSE